MSEVAVKTVGTPNGPEKFIPEFGCSVPTFVEPPGGKNKALTYHVPFIMRGDFRPTDLANYDSKKTYRTDELGRVLCYAVTKSENPCRRRAVNRYPRCDIHGGRLHPLDKVVDTESGSNDQETQALSRYKQYLAGQITVDDLDDEELASCGFRAINGTIYKPRNVPRELVQAFTKAVFDRATQELRANVVRAAQTMAEIMQDKTVEPDVRLKAATTLIERNLGKTPTVVQITGQQPWEEIFDGIASGTRESSRATRAISERIDENSSGATSFGAEGTVDAEIVEEGFSAGHESSSPNALGDRQSGDANGNAEHVPFGRDSVASQELTEENQVGNSGGRRDSESGSPKDIEQQGIRDSVIGKAALFQRHEAIVSPVVEFRSTKYDLTDKNAGIKKATQKRWISRSLGIDVTGEAIPIEFTVTENDDGSMHFVPITPEPVKVNINTFKTD